MNLQAVRRSAWGATSGSDKGTWVIESNGTGAYPILNSQSGNGQRRFAITGRKATNEVLLNGAKYFVQTQTDCN